MCLEVSNNYNDDNNDSDNNIKKKQIDIGINLGNYWVKNERQVRATLA